MAVYQLEGELVELTAPTLLHTLDWLTPGAVGTVILDCRELTFVDARGLTALLRARAIVAGAHAALALAHPSRMLTRLLTATALTEALPLADAALLDTVHGIVQSGHRAPR